MQTGGVDPGLAALVAAILSGSVGAYGFSKTSASDRSELQNVIEANLKREIGERLKEEATAAVSQKDAEIKRLEGELAQLRASTVVTDSSSDADLTFREAKPEVLRAAIPIVMSKLATSYPKINLDGSPTLKTALEYPASLSGRLRRMTLADFYRKRVEPALRIDLQTRGQGRKRRHAKKKGGDMEADLAAVEAEAPVPLEPAGPNVPGSAASYASPYPKYEEFAPLYVESIKEAAQSLATKALTDKATTKQTAEQAKKDAIAKKAAETIIAKFDTAIKAADKALMTPVAEDQQEVKRKLSETLDKARELVGMAPPKKKLFGFFGGASNLREVMTETEWNEMNTPQKAEEVLKELQDATTAYLNAVQASSLPAISAFGSTDDAPAPVEPPPPVPEAPAPEAASDPGSASSIGNEELVPNPLFMMNRKKEARGEQEAVLAAETPEKNNAIKRTRKERFGGKLRKRTLKKRRGGK